MVWGWVEGVSQTRAAISGGVGHGNPKSPAKAPRIHGNHILQATRRLLKFRYMHIRSCQGRKVILAREVKQR